MRKRPTIAILSAWLLLSANACTTKRFLYEPPVPAVPDSALYDKVDLIVALWEDVEVEGLKERTGGIPTYIEPVKATLERMGLFEQVNVAPWRPAHGEVFLKITDRANVNLHWNDLQTGIWATFLLVGLPLPFLKYDADISSRIEITSDPLPGLEPLHISRPAKTRVQGKLMAFYGADDARQLLAGNHALYVGELVGTWFIEHHDWFRKAKLATQPQAAASRK